MVHMARPGRCRYSGVFAPGNGRTKTVAIVVDCPGGGPVPLSLTVNRESDSITNSINIAVQRYSAGIVLTRSVHAFQCNTLGISLVIHDSNIYSLVFHRLKGARHL